MTKLILETLSKKYRSLYAVRDVDLHVESGELVAILGPSGSGKTTILRLIAGLEQPTAGRILIRDRCVNDLRAAERDVAMVFQNHALFPHMSVYENLGFAPRVRKLPESQIRAAVFDVATKLGVEAKLGELPATLSGGQRQRVALGRAMLQKPELFLLDEPLSSLEPVLRTNLRTELIHWHKSVGSTSLLVTHDQSEALALGDRILVLNNGRVEQIGTGQQLYQTPANQWVARFIGPTSMNIFPGEIVANAIVLDEQLKLPISGTTAERLAALSGRRVRVGIRPEDIGPDRASNSMSVSAKVLSRQNLGAETVQELQTGSLKYLAIDRNRTNDCQEGAFHWNLDRLHFFDPTTGVAIP